jgi:hypothetical protein
MLMFVNRLALLVRASISSCLLTGFLVAQPSLKITSPGAGTTAHPGESLTVTVEVLPPEGAFRLVTVIGLDPIGFAKEKLDAPPYRFTVHIPTTIAPDTYLLTAAGFSLSTGQLVNSDPINILVERTDSPVSISVYPTVADFTMHQKRYLQVTALYADKTTADLTQSSRIRYLSGAPDIATVNAQGIVTPTSPGSTKIRITYGDLKLDVPVRVRQSQQ